MKVTVYGAGYVGLVQAAVLADAGHSVCCVDIDEQKVEQLKKGIVPIYEPGLSELVKESFQQGRLLFTTDAKQGVDFAPLQFIAVDTPPDEDGSADLKYVLKVSETIATFMNDSKVVINKSTVPVGTAKAMTTQVTEILATRGESIEFSVVSNPEFLKEGSAVSDCRRPDRIVIGTASKSAEKLLRELYAPFNRNHEKIIVMAINSAELTKYAANCMLATKISFMNEMANIAERVGADIEDVRQGIGADERIGYHFIYPGCGYGGSCFPKDVQALSHVAAEVGYQPDLLHAIESINDRQKKKLVEYVMRHFDGNIAGKTFALWGLSFKPKTNDMRGAPSRVLMETLWAAGAKVQAYDPAAMEECQRIYGVRDDLTLMGTKEAALNGADGLVICTEWQSFKAPDFELIKNALANNIQGQAAIFDGRNLFDPVTMRQKGFIYWSIGRLVEH